MKIQTLDEKDFFRLLSLDHRRFLGVFEGHSLLSPTPHHHFPA